MRLDVVGHAKLSRRWLQALRAILFSAFAAVLVWGVIARTFAAFLAADGTPEQALHIRSQQSTALVALAQKYFNGLDSFDVQEPVLERDRANAENVEQARRMAEQALFADPLNARALRLLGQIADRSGDEQLAQRLMQAAARRSLNETMAVAWMMGKSAEQRDYPAVMRYADILLRSRPQVRLAIIPFLAWMAENGDTVAEIKDLLSRNPPWRAQFFDALPGNIADARTPLNLLMAVKDSPVPPTTKELRGYLNFLISRQFYALAYYTWLQFQLPEQLASIGYVVNGGFEAPPSALPFDWSISEGAGTTVGVDTPPGERTNHALFVRFDNGRVEFSGVSQLVVLSPASYRLEATYKGELLGRRGLKWRVTCVGGTTGVIGESRMILGESSSWKPLQFTFSVPSSDCPAQYVRLDLDARMESERFVSGEVWFDNLQISRVNDARWKTARRTLGESAFLEKWHHGPEN